MPQITKEAILKEFRERYVEEIPNDWNRLKGVREQEPINFLDESIEALLTQSKEEARKEADEAGYHRAFDEIEQADYERLLEARNKGIDFAINAINMHLQGYGCRIEYPFEKDIIFFDDTDELGDRINFDLIIRKEMKASLTKTEGK